jgi:hydroxymethylglutaryl-CoA reductase (NADPH)
MSSRTPADHPDDGRIRVPRDPDDDYTHDQAAARRRFIREQTGAELSHVGRYSFDPGTLPGNIEHFIGAA